MIVLYNCALITYQVVEASPVGAYKGGILLVVALVAGAYQEVGVHLLGEVQGEGASTLKSNNKIS